MEVALDAVGPVPLDVAAELTNGTCRTRADDNDTAPDTAERNGTGADPPADDYEPLLRRPRRSLAIYEAPEFTKRLNSFVEAEVGATVVFECHFKALSKPNVTWFLDDKEVVNGRDEHVHLNVIDCKGILQLIIDGCRKGDEGAYKCKVENSEGSASTTGYLSVTGEDNEKNIAQQKKKAPKAPKEGRSVSLPPHLRTIVEQKSLEEKEYEITKALPPSPIQDYIDLAVTRRAGTWPKGLLPEYENNVDIDDGSSSIGSDTSVESQAGSEPDFELMSDEDVTSPGEIPIPSNTNHANGDRPLSPGSPGNKPYWAYPEHDANSPESDIDVRLNLHQEEHDDKPTSSRQSRSRRPKLKLTRTDALSDQDSSDDEQLDDDVFIADSAAPPSILDRTVVLVPDDDTHVPEPPTRDDSLPAHKNNDSPADTNHLLDSDDTSLAPTGGEEIRGPPPPGREEPNARGTTPAEAIISPLPPPDAEYPPSGNGSTSQLESDDKAQRADAATATASVEITDLSAAGSASQELPEGSGADISTAAGAENAGSSESMEHFGYTEQISPEQLLVNLAAGVSDFSAQQHDAGVSQHPTQASLRGGDCDSLGGSLIDLPGEITVTLGVGEATDYGENFPELISTIPDYNDLAPASSDTDHQQSADQWLMDLSNDVSSGADLPEEDVPQEDGVIEITSEDLLTLNLSSPISARQLVVNGADQICPEVLPEIETAPVGERQESAVMKKPDKPDERQSGTHVRGDAPVVRMRENRAKLRHKRAGLSKVLSKSFETGTLPGVDWDAFFEFLDSFWIYYVVLSVLAAFAASATGVSPFYLIVIVALLSFIGFSLLSSLDETPDSLVSGQDEDHSATDNTEGNVDSLANTCNDESTQCSRMASELSLSSTTTAETNKLRDTTSSSQGDTIRQRNTNEHEEDSGTSKPTAANDLMEPALD